jgi:hypothetical protein
MKLRHKCLKMGELSNICVNSSFALPVIEVKESSTDDCVAKM